MCRLTIDIIIVMGAWAKAMVAMPRATSRRESNWRMEMRSTAAVGVIDEPTRMEMPCQSMERSARIATAVRENNAAVAKYGPPRRSPPKLAIRNNILMVLAHKSSAQILGAEGKTKLSGELQRATARAIGIEVDEPEEDEEAAADAPKKKKKKKKSDDALPIVAVHFSNFIVQ